MYCIIKSVKTHNCHTCGLEIEKKGYKVKWVNDNHKYHYYHLPCVPLYIAEHQLSLWNECIRNNKELQLEN